MDQDLVHGIFTITKSLFSRKCYDTMPKRLGAGISVSQIPLPALYRCIYDLNMMDRECFLEDFSPGIGMLLTVPETQCNRAVKIIEKHHKCHVLGKIEKDDEYPDAKVWIV